MDQYKDLANSLSAIIFKLDNGEELRIKNPIDLTDDEETRIGVIYECRYYDVTGAHTITKSVCVSYDHIVYTKFEFKEGVNAR